MRPRASSTITLRPATLRSRAAARPAAPAPMIRTSAALLLKAISRDSYKETSREYSGTLRGRVKVVAITDVIIYAYICHREKRVMRILIIGGNGFIGKPLVRQLNEQEHSVGVFHRDKGKAARPAEVEEIIGDRRELGNYRGAIREFAPDVVIDLILSSGKQAEELIETVRGVGSTAGNHRLKSGLPRIVAISSMDVYRACGVLHGSEPGPLEPLPLTEESALRKATQTYPVERLQQLQNVFGWIDEAYDKVAVERAIVSASDVFEFRSEAEAGRYYSRFFNGG